MSSFPGWPEIYMTHDVFARLHPHDRDNAGLDQIPLTLSFPSTLVKCNRIKNCRHEYDQMDAILLVRLLPSWCKSSRT
jgi:hypothetical protein